MRVDNRAGEGLNGWGYGHGFHAAIELAFFENGRKNIRNVIE